MTSSLVGSEMCIRDSLLEDSSMVSDMARPVPAAPGAWPVAACTREARPVSYTHLTLPTICSV
eukprot:12097051-Prorocentrum_lima.AAC.1